MGSIVSTSMESGKERIKISVSEKNRHLFLAAFFWSAIGIGLGARGGYFLFSENALIWMLPCMLIGLVKSTLILDKTAKKNIVRIDELDADAGFFSMFSSRSWWLILGMCFIGLFVRHAGFSYEIVGAVLFTVGSALMFSSRHTWKAWFTNFRSKQQCTDIPKI